MTQLVAVSASDVESILLVRQCRYLESSYGLNFTSSILSSSMSLSPSKMKKTIIDKDIELLLSKAASVPHLRYVYKLWLKIQIAAGPRCGILPLIVVPLVLHVLWQCLNCSAYGLMEETSVLLWAKKLLELIFWLHTQPLWMTVCSP